MASSTSVRHFFHDFHPQRHTLPTTVLHTKSSASPASLTLSASTSSSVNTPTSVSFSSVSSTQPSKMLVVKSSSSTHLPIMEDRLDTLSHGDALLSVIPPFTKSKSSQFSTLHHHDDDAEHDVSCSEHRSPSSPSSSSSLLGHLRRSFWNCKCYCLFSTLPDELMIFNLFSFFSHEELAVVAHTSKRWRWLVSDPALWKYLDFSQKKLSDQALISIIRRFGASIETLKLCNNMHLTETSLALLGEETPQLRELHLCHLHPINDSIVNAIATNCHHLQHLSLFGCTQVTDEAVKALGLNLSDTLNDLSLRNCPLLTDDSMAALPSNLRGLNIASNRRITGEGVSALAARCPRLERVNVHSILVTDQSVDCLSKNCKNLSTLHLSSSNPFGGNVRLTDQAMESLSSLKRLRCLNLQGNSSLTDHGMARLVSSLPKLQRLNLGGCYRITDLSLAFLAKHNPQLTHLSLFQCFHITDKGLMMMMLGLKSLIHLDVHSCVGLTSQTLAVLSMEVDDDESEQEESDSDNESTSPGHRESFTSDKGRTPTGKRIRSLLEDSDDEDDSEFSELDADEQMNGRTSTPRLSLSTSSQNDSISSTASNYYLPRLRTLDVGACRQVTVEDIRGLQSVRPNLQVVFHQP